jgi:iron complex transport system substrate-binding protein
MNKYVLLGCFVFIFFGLVCGCGVQSSQRISPTGGYVFTDALGDTISVDKPQRVVALMGGFAETWLLAGGSLVGVSDDAINERNLELPEATANLGFFRSPHVESIVALDPDLVLLSAETPAHTALKGTLNNAGIATAYFSVTHFEDYLEMLKIFTEITGNTEGYQSYGLAVEQEINDWIELARQKMETTGEEPPSILFLITASSGIHSQDSDTMTGRMLKKLGCVNIIDESPSPLRHFSMEMVIMSDPDYIFVVPMGHDGGLAEKHLRESITSNPAWRDLTAVKNGRYILLPQEKFLYKPNQRWGESYSYLYEILFK